MSGILIGRKNWNGTKDSEGYRNYDIVWLVKTTSIQDGPTTILGTPGLPVSGTTTWSFGRDVDTEAICGFDTQVNPVVTDQPDYWWLVTQKFTTKPINWCGIVQNPLLEPAEVRGTFVKFRKESHEDKDGKTVRSSSHEMFRGAQIEWDSNNPSVSISQNLATLPLSTFAPMIDTVNDSALWGLGARHIKLTNAPWERNFQDDCTFYYKVTYEFDIDDGENGFDRQLIDEGTKVFTGTDRNNPKHWTAYKEEGSGENSRVIFNSSGNPLEAGEEPAKVNFRKYVESNFTLLGIPSSF